MDVSFADKLGTKDRQILGVSIINGELQLNLDKPETMGWQELIYFIKYVIAQSLAEEADLSIGDIFQWLGSQGIVADEVESQAIDIMDQARQERIRQLMKDEKLRLDQVDR
jgi:hypothetical protein